MNAPFKIKVQPRTVIRANVDARFPANVIGATPVHVDQIGMDYTISVDIDELRDLVINPTRWTDIVVQLTDGPTVPLDASQGNQFRLLAAGNRTILAPSNPPAPPRSQKIVIIHEASGAPRTLQLTTGASGSFRFGSDLGTLTTTPAGLVDYVGAIWNQNDNRWDVVSYARGF